MRQIHKRAIIEIAETNLSDASKISYENNIKLFYDFSGIKKTSELIHMTKEKLQDHLIDYVRYVNTLAKAGKISNNTVPKRFKGIKYVLDINYRENDVMWKPIRAMYPEKNRLTGYKPYTTEQIQVMLNQTDSRRNKAMIHFMASLGARIGIHDHPLLMKHLVPMTYQKENDCYGVLLYAADEETPEEKDQNTTLDKNDGYSYYSFLTPEATTALKEYFDERKRQGEIFDLETPIFRTFAEGKYNKCKIGIEVKQLTRRGALSLMFRLVSNSNVNREKKGRRYNIQMDHGFRKRFNTILKLEASLNSNIAEKLMAHKRGLDGTYLTPTRDELFKEFVKAIHQLTIDSSARDKILLEQKNQEINELKIANNRIESLEKKMDLTHRFYQNMVRTKEKGANEEIKTPKVAETENCPSCSQESHDKIGDHYKCLNPDCRIDSFQE